MRHIARIPHGPVSALTVLLLVLVAPRFAHAQTCDVAAASVPDCGVSEPDEATTRRAERQYEEGLAHVADERWDDAVRSFTASYRTGCNPAALANIAYSYRSLGRWVEARATARAVLERHDTQMTGAVREVATDLIRQATGEVAALTLEGVPEDPRPIVRVDGRACADPGARPLDVDVDPGSRVLDLVAPGLTSFHWEGDIAPAQRLHLDVEMPPLPTGHDWVGWTVGLSVAGAAVIGLVIGLSVFFAGQGPAFDAQVEI